MEIFCIIFVEIFKEKINKNEGKLLKFNSGGVSLIWFWEGNFISFSRLFRINFQPTWRARYKHRWSIILILTQRKHFNSSSFSRPKLFLSLSFIETTEKNGFSKTSWTNWKIIIRQRSSATSLRLFRMADKKKQFSPIAQRFSHRRVRVCVNIYELLIVTWLLLWIIVVVVVDEHFFFSESATLLDAETTFRI